MRIASGLALAFLGGCALVHTRAESDAGTIGRDAFAADTTRSDAASPDSTFPDTAIADAARSDAVSEEASTPDVGIDAHAEDASVAPDAGDPSPRYGVIEITRSHEPTDTDFSIFGRFGIDTGVDHTLTAFDCVDIERIGDCRTVHCGGVVPRTESAGLLDVRSAASEETLSPTRAYVRQWTDPRPFFGAGDLVSFTAHGATVPAFDGNVIAPAPPTVAFPGDISVSADLALTWAPSDADEIVIVVGPDTADAADAGWVFCSAPGAAGSVTLPHAMLAPHVAGQTVRLWSHARSTSTTVAGEYTIELRADQVDATWAMLVP